MLYIKTGTYTGNGTDNTDIDIGLDLTVSGSIYLHIWSDDNDEGIFRTSSMVGDQSMSLTAASSYATNQIQGFNSTGFQVGSSVKTNESAIVYYYLCIIDTESDYLYVGSYTGDGLDDKAVATPFQPDILLVKRAGANSGVYKTSSSVGEQSDKLNAVASIATDAIQALTSTGFTVGTDTHVNNSGDTYQFVALRHLSGYIGSGTYEGNVTDNRNITTAGINPSMVWVSRDETGSSSESYVKQSLMSGETAVAFHTTATSTSNIIQSLGSGSFQVGTNNAANGSGLTYLWTAFADGVLTMPTVTTDSVASVTSTSAVADGAVTGDGGLTVTDRGFVYSLSPNPTTADTVVTSGSGMGGFSETITGLSANTTYHVRAYAINALGTSYGTDEQFTTLTTGVVVDSLSILVGAYTGDGVDNRNIDIGYDLTVGGSIYVQVWSEGAHYSHFRTSAFTGDESLPFDTSTGLIANVIQGFNSSGFQVGSNANINTNGTVYHYLVIIDPQEEYLYVGRYTGTGIAHDITGVPFSPDIVIVKCEDTAGITQAVYKTRQMAGEHTNVATSSSSATGAITTLNSDGFGVGTSTRVNDVLDYQFVCMKLVTAAIFSGQYVGDGVDNRIISTPDIQPALVVIDRDSTSAGTSGMAKSSLMAGELAVYSSNIAASASDTIQEITDYSIELGTDASVNSASAYNYMLLAFGSVVNYTPPAPSLAKAGSLMGKRYTAKVYDRAGATYLGTIRLTADPTFTLNLNSGLGPATFDLAIPFDQSNGLIEIGNEIQVWVTDRDAPMGVKVYSGFINEYKPSATGTGESIEVVAYGYVARLGYSLLRSSNVFSISYSADDPSDIFMDLIDKYRAGVLEERGNYSGDSVDVVGTTVSTEFNAAHYKDALDVVQRLAGADYYWYWDADNLISFRQYPTTFTHLLTFGKEIVSLELNATASQMVNNILFWNGLESSDPNYIYELYRDATSEADYWHRMEVVVDGRYTVQSSAETEMTSRIDRLKDPVRSLVVRVRDNNYSTDGYDIESIEPGHTIRVLNLGFDSPLPDNMLVSRVNYTPGYIDLYIDDVELLTSRVLNSLRKQIVANQATDLPSGSATVVNV